MPRLIGLLALFVTLSAGRSQVPSPQGRIQGHVVSDSQLPVAEAFVAFVIPERPTSGPLMGAKTDKDGEFLSPLLDVGYYNLITWKPSADVPSPLYAIYEPLGYKVVKVEVAENKTTSGVILKLPAPFGTMHLVVVDAETNQRIGNARIIVRRRENKDIHYAKGIGSKGELSLLLPQRQMEIELSAPGYLNWKYVQQSTKQQYMTLDSEQQQDVIARLVRVNRTQRNPD